MNESRTIVSAEDFLDNLLALPRLLARSLGTLVGGGPVRPLPAAPAAVQRPAAPALPPPAVAAPPPAALAPVRPVAVRGDGGGLEQAGVKLVRYAIVSVRAGAERLLPGGTGQVMVTEAMSGEAFALWIVARYIQSPDPPRTISPEDRKSLRVYYELLERWERQPLKFHGKQLVVLEEIRRAILDGCDGRERPAPGRLALPPAPPRALPAAPPPEPPEAAQDSAGLERRVLSALRELGGDGATAELVRRSGLSNSQVRRSLRALEARGGVRRSGQGLQTRYHLPREGSGR
jgi:hypothetical protein